MGVQGCQVIGSTPAPRDSALSPTANWTSLSPMRRGDGVEPRRPSLNPEGRKAARRWVWPRAFPGASADRCDQAALPGGISLFHRLLLLLLHPSPCFDFPGSVPTSGKLLLSGRQHTGLGSWILRRSRAGSTRSRPRGRVGAGHGFDGGEREGSESTGPAATIRRRTCRTTEARKSPPRSGAGARSRFVFSPGNPRSGRGDTN